MYKHILLPTDGSALSSIAIENGLRFAKAIGAKVTGFHVTVERQAESFEDYAPIEAKAPKLEEVAKQEAEQYLKVIADKARALGVDCQTYSMRHIAPHQAIITMATQIGCDLIVMASHGRKGVTGDLVGSETTRVISQCKIPVLVYR
jgi:nucleotide-binding universal stress UspA family protein